MARKKPRVVRSSKDISLSRHASTKSTHNCGSDNDDLFGDDIIDMFEKEDLESLKQLTGKNFLHAAEGRESGKKRKFEDESDESDGEDYEHSFRNNFGTNKKVRYLLPLKGKDGLIPQVSIEEEEVDDKVENEGETHNTIEPNGIENLNRSPRSYIEMYAQRKKKIALKKRTIAMLSCTILENPEENLRSLKELVNLLGERDPEICVTVKKLACLSLLEVFCDILPDYRIRLPTDKEKHMKLKKETRKLRDYEESLLRYYKRYLQCLESMCRGVQVTIKDQAELSTKVSYSLAIIAVKCFSRLLVTHSHFNFRNNIINVIVPLMAHKSKEVANVSCCAIMQLYKEDKLGEASFEAVKETRKLIKRRNYNIPADVLKTFLYLNIREVDSRNAESQKKDMKKVREQLKMMSRKERRRRKKMEKLEKELLEAEAEENKNKRGRIHLEVLKYIFTTYFHILKNSTKSDLLTPVLEGLSKYAHFINVEFFDDLLTVLHKLLDSEDMSVHDSLHCIQTVFTVLSGEGESLNIDPQRFYVAMYKLLQHLNITLPFSDIETLLACLDVMFTKRKKKLTLQRVLAFIKRLCTVALNLPHKGTVKVMAFLRMMIMNHKQSDILLDNENNFGSGIFLPELEDPEHCNAHASSLWELHELRRHYHPLVTKYADHLLQGCKT